MKTKQKIKSRCLHPVCSALERWAAAAAVVRVKVPKWMCFPEDDRPTVISIGCLVLSVKLKIEGGWLYEAQLCSDNEHGWENMMPDDANGEGASPDVAVMNCIHAAIKELADESGSWRDAESNRLSRHVKTALREVLRLMQNMNYPDNNSR